MYRGLRPNGTTFYQSEIPLLLPPKFPGFFLNGKRPISLGFTFGRTLNKDYLEFCFVTVATLTTDLLGALLDVILIIQSINHIFHVVTKSQLMWPLEKCGYRLHI